MKDSALLYGRVSTGQQTSSTQELRGKEYLAWKQIELAGEFYDDDVSGTIAIWERPGGRRLRQRLNQGDIKHLVVAKLDRLGRSAVDLLNTVKHLDSIGVVLHIVDLGGDSLSTQGPSGRLMFTVLAGMAEYERELIVSRINEKLSAKRSRGELVGTVPFGWDAAETGEITRKGVKVRKLVSNVTEQKWLLYMVELRDAGWSYHAIAKALNQYGVPTKRRAGQLMTLRQGAGVTEKFTSGKWQSGNVAKLINSKQTQSWLAQRSAGEQAVA
jgi:DNA invertase Pin-like site-specific DNA recombinase